MVPLSLDCPCYLYFTVTALLGGLRTPLLPFRVYETFLRKQNYMRRACYRPRPRAPSDPPRFAYCCCYFRRTLRRPRGDAVAAALRLILLSLASRGSVLLRP